MPGQASFDSRAFRDAMGCFATGVCVATTRDATGRPVGVTVNSFSSVSLDPPLVLFCLDRSADSFPAFVGAKGFALTVLAEEQRHLSSMFALAPVAARWEGVAVEQWETGSPIITGGLASLDCALHAIHDGGDHAILVGRVLRLSSRGDVAPLLYFRGGYRGLRPAE